MQVATANYELQPIGCRRGKWKQAILNYRLLAVGEANGNGASANEQCVQAIGYGRGNGNEWGAAYVDLLTRVMAADFAALPRLYDRAVHLSLPGGRTEHGVTEADRFWIGLRAAFPSATLDVQHVIGREDPLMPPRAAVRWVLTGRHDGRGMFGEPTGAEVFLWGASHAEFGPRGIRREYVIFDEVAVWTQILLARG